MIQRLLPFLTLIALFVTLSIASPNFLTATNLSSVVRQTAVINIMASVTKGVKVPALPEITLQFLLTKVPCRRKIAMDRCSPMDAGGRHKPQPTPADDLGCAGRGTRRGIRQGGRHAPGLCPR